MITKEQIQSIDKPENCKHELENDTLKNYDKYCIHCGVYLGTYPKYSYPEKTNPAK